MAGRVRTREWAGVDYYADLGITAGASQPAVDEAFRRRAKALHPDRNREATAEDQFKRLTVAYEVLRDPVTRRAYDDFRFRVNAGLLYGSGPAPGPARPPGRPSGPGSYAEASRRARPERRMPDGLRVALAWLLVVGALGATLWAFFGPLPAHSVGDTPLGVQITLGIIALKLAACAVVAFRYPQLRARWHHPPAGGSPTRSASRAT